MIRMMRFKHYYIFLLAILVISGCGKDLPYDTLHSRVIGTWYTDEVTFREKGSLICKDVTANWDQYKYIFNEDESFMLVNHETGEFYDGYWYINEYYTSSSSNTSNKNQELIFVVFDENLENYVEYVLLDPGVTSSKLKGRRKANNGTYKYTLKK